MGIASDLPMVPSLALGTGEVTLLELTAAYTAFANEGQVAMPRVIRRVEDARGNILYDAGERRVQAISPTTAFLMSSMLSDVVSSGTAYGVRSAGFKLPAAGKTGTTDDYADAWFVGYTPHLVAGVWFGLDKPAPIMARGFASTVAVPAWGRFMHAATKGAKPDWYTVPRDVEKVTICRLTGARASDACRHRVEPPPAATMADPFQMVAVTTALPSTAPDEPPVYEDLFPRGSVPSEPCTLHSSAASSPSSTPMVDAALRASGIQAARATGSVRDARIVVERVLGPDGVTRMVMRVRDDR
jgi:membrane carboxypeptidase/penicillin-binding protein